MLVVLSFTGMLFSLFCGFDAYVVYAFSELMISLTV